MMGRGFNMHTASLENCKRLYELSGWDDMRDRHGWIKDGAPIAEIPRYSAGYLLRKLPKYREVERGDYMLHLAPVYMENRWQAFYHLDSRNPEYIKIDKVTKTVADTPEDALCLLAIKLFEEGVLK